MLVADVNASGRWKKTTRVNYFNLSSGVLSRTSSHTCSRWYLPIFLSRDGSLTFNCLFNCSHKVLVLPPHNVEIVDGNIVTSDVKMVKYLGRGLQMFSEPFSKSSWGLSNVLFITLHPVTLVSIDDFTFLLYRIFIFGSHQGISDGSTSFKVHLYPIFAANLLNTLTKPWSQKWKKSSNMQLPKPAVPYKYTRLCSDKNCQSARCYQEKESSETNAW